MDYLVVVAFYNFNEIIWLILVYVALKLVFLKNIF